MSGHGGKREGSGRKGKSEEQKLVEKLKPLEQVALDKLKIGVESGDFVFLKLYMEYMYGKPKQQLDVDLNANVINVQRPKRDSKV